MDLSRLRLGASSKTVAFADLSADDIIANMSDEQKVALAGKLAPPKAEEPAKEPEAEAKEPAKGAEAPKDDAGANAADPSHVQFGHGVTAERARCAAVFASEHYAGREAQANEMLGTSMSAEEIGKVLAKAPKAGGDAMLAGLKGAANPDLGAGAASEPDAKKAAAASWDKTFETMGWTKPADRN